MGHKLDSESCVIALDTIYGVILVANFILSICYRDRRYYTAMVAGCVFEILGFTANYFTDDVVQTVVSTVGARLAALHFVGAIYFTFADIMKVCGAKYSVVRPKVFRNIFIYTGLVVYLLTLMPSIVTIRWDTEVCIIVRQYTSLAAAAVLMVLLVIFMALAGLYLYHVKGAVDQGSYEPVKRTSVNYELFVKVRKSHYFATYVTCHLLASLLILMTCVSSIVSLARGRNNVTMFDFECVAVLIAVILMTLCGPGPALRKKEAVSKKDVVLRRRRRDKEGKEKS